jgi:aminoglycoside phosphotransferase (APT) family kinase protein
VDGRASALAGGYWNEVFRVRAEGRDLVVKHYGTKKVAVTLFPMLPADEARAMALLAGKGLAPDPVGYWPQAGEHGAVVVYHFVPGVMWEGPIEQAAGLLRRLHALDGAGFRVSPAEPGDLLAHADGLPCPPEADRAWRRLRAVRPAPGPVPALRRRLIHGDFSAGNMVAGPAGVRCIDWQCPADGDPCEDLWTFLSPSFRHLYDRPAWTVDELARFRAAYGDERTLARFDAMAPYYAWRFAKYCAFRVHQLAPVDPVASERYRRGAEAEIALLEARAAAGCAVD